MKRILFVLLCLMLVCCGCKSTKQEAPVVPAAQAEQGHQVILIKYIAGSTATLEWYGADKKLLMSCPAIVGKNGVGKEKDGDGKTPLGEFAILCGFGIKKNPGTKLNYIEATPNLYLCGEKANYNKFVSDSKCKHTAACEKIVAFKPNYNYAIFLDYNKECVFGKGSGIFLQCKGAKNATAGGIAIDEANMLKLLQGVEPTARVIIQK